MDSKSEVKQLQRALRETVAPTIVVNGNWGKESEAALAQFAKTNGVELNEAKKLLQRYADLRYVGDDAFAKAASVLGVKESYVRAIAEVESAGDSFLKDGRVKILFERHWFFKKLKEALKKPEVCARVATKLVMALPPANVAPTILLAQMVAKYGNICNDVRGGYKGNEAEWDRLNLAMDFDIEAACQSTSFGGYQIMGFNHKACGYASARDMMLDFAKSESQQFLALVAFIKANPEMHTALKRGDWAKFAELYNGSAYRENKYDTKLASAEKKWQDAAIA